MIDSDDIEKYQVCCRLMKEGKYEDALHQVESIKNKGFRAGILVDAGFALRKSGKVREGLTLFQELLSGEDGDEFSRDSLLYNTANGFMSIYSLRRQRRAKTIPPNDLDLRSAKRLYRECLKELSGKSSEFASQAYVNYGNCLSHLGRFAESIQFYQAGLEAEPTNGMAAGNLGIELEHVARITGRYYHEYMALAHSMLTCALSESMHLKFGSPEAIASFKNYHDYLTHFLKAHKDPILVPEPAKPIGKSKRKIDYVQFCIHNGLFLNAWVGEPQLSPGITDELSYGPITTSREEQDLVPELLRILNEIKEAYATARYLFYLSHRKDQFLNDVSSMTLYFNNLDYSVNGIYTGLCKTAYIRAFDILDKVARIINVYFKIGKRKDTFWNLFAEKQSHGEDHIALCAARPTITAFENNSLNALSDICIDYFEREQLDLSTIDTRRNRITHDYLSVRLFHSNNETEEITDFDKFAEQTKDVLALARLAVIYAVSAVNLSEQQKETGGKVGHLTYEAEPGKPYL